MSKHIQPFFKIEEALKVYKYALKKNPTFGIDIFKDEPFDKEIIILQKEETVKKGTPIKFGFFALLLYLEGESIRHINQYEYKIRKTSFQLLPPGAICSFESVTEKTEVYILLFTEDFIKSHKDNHVTENIQLLFEYHKANIDNVFLSSNMFTRVKAIYDDINVELHEKKDDYRTIIKLLILKLLFILKRAKVEQNQGSLLFETNAKRIAHDYLELIEKHFIDLQKVSDYANLLNITPKHLSETISTICSKSALSCIHHRIMQESFYLLEYTHLSINQIASSLNFHNPSDFSRFFKYHYKTTPKQYRLNMQK